jgi:pimeloyl-ACP methyl ester carboxylesterase
LLFSALHFLWALSELKLERKSARLRFRCAMFDLLDLLLLKRGLPADDQSLAFRRIDGNPQSKVVYFLPWNTPFAFARSTGMAPLDFLAAYEMPPAIVSSDPHRSVEALHGLVGDAKAVLTKHGVAPRDALLVGLSVGTYAATYLANQLAARLCFVAGADRADLMMWQSPAARLVKKRAMQKGYRWSHYAKAMLGYHPVHNLAGIARDSLFVLGQRDPFVPPRRADGLLSAIEKQVPGARTVKLNGGHLKTLMASGRHQLQMAGAESPARWQLRLPRFLARAGRVPGELRTL